MDIAVLGSYSLKVVALLLYDNKEEEEEWDGNIKQYQLISTVKEINFDNLLRFWLIPIYIPNILFVPKPSIEPNNDK